MIQRVHDAESVLVSMMCIGKVLVCVRQRLMAMAVSMRGSWGDGLCVRMLMVLIVGVLMFMLQDLVRMGMPMALGQVQPNEIGRAHSELQSLMRISYAVFCLQKK